jgi:hypothetical protein
MWCVVCAVLGWCVVCGPWLWCGVDLRCAQQTTHHIPHTTHHTDTHNPTQHTHHVWSVVCGMRCMDLCNDPQRWPIACDTSQWDDKSKHTPDPFERVTSWKRPNPACRVDPAQLGGSALVCRCMVSGCVVSWHVCCVRCTVRCAVSGLWCCEGGVCSVCGEVCCRGVRSVCGKCAAVYATKTTKMNRSTTFAGLDITRLARALLSWFHLKQRF